MDRVMGVCATPKAVRVAVLNFNNGQATFENANNAHLHRLQFPKDTTARQDMLNWYYKELDTIASKFPGIVSVGIKIPEFGVRPAMDDDSKRCRNHLDGVTMLWAAQHSVASSTLLFNQLGCNSKSVEEWAEQRTGKTTTLWDLAMASAAAAGWQVGQS